MSGMQASCYPNRGNSQVPAELRHHANSDHKKFALAIQIPLRKEQKFQVIAVNILDKIIRGHTHPLAWRTGTV
jgi:hypothetical protein